MARESTQGQAAPAAKRVLVIDADAAAWEGRTKLLIAKGHLVHRVSQLGDAPHQWPAHLYDLVILAPGGDASAMRGFCRDLKKANSQVMLGLLAEDAAAAQATGVAADVYLNPEGTAAEFAELVDKLLRDA